MPDPLDLDAIEKRARTIAEHNEFWTTYAQRTDLTEEQRALVVHVRRLQRDLEDALRLATVMADSPNAVRYEGESSVRDAYLAAVPALVAAVRERDRIIADLQVVVKGVMLPKAPRGGAVHITVDRCALCKAYPGEPHGGSCPRREG